MARLDITDAWQGKFNGLLVFVSLHGNLDIGEWDKMITLKDGESVSTVLTAPPGICAVSIPHFVFRRSLVKIDDMKEDDVLEIAVKLMSDVKSRISRSQAHSRFIESGPVHSEISNRYLNRIYQFNPDDTTDFIYVAWLDHDRLRYTRMNLNHLDTSVREHKLVTKQKIIKICFRMCDELHLPRKLFYIDSACNLRAQGTSRSHTRAIRSRGVLGGTRHKLSR